MEDTKGTVEQHHQPSETLKKAIALVGGRLAVPEALQNLPEPSVEVAARVAKEVVENWKPTPANLPASRVLRSEKSYPENLKEAIIDLPDGSKGLGNVEADVQPATDACEHDHPSVAETLAEDALKPKDKPLTETQFRALRRAFFTVRHLVLPDCGHKLDQINQPKNNCEYCWWAFFSSHGELVQVTDRAYQEQGSDFLDKMRGQKYRKMFIRYMSTLARLQKEAAELAEKEKQNAVVEGSESEVRGDQASGIGDGQEVRTDGNVPESGQESRQGNPVDLDRVSDSR